VFRRFGRVGYLIASKKNLFCGIFPTKQAKKTCFAEYSQQSKQKKLVLQNIPNKVVDFNIHTKFFSD